MRSRRRSFLEGCVSIIYGGLAMNNSSDLAQTVTNSSVSFFPGFQRRTIETSGTTINAVVGGDGPPVLLLHGYPQTHVEWRKIAPELAKSYTLVIPDLRGYGDSGKPPDGDNHINYSKRAMALDQVEVMEKLGFKRFAVVSHDRGARVAHRLALDHPDRHTKLVLIDTAQPITCTRPPTGSSPPPIFIGSFLFNPRRSRRPSSGTMSMFS